MRRFPSCLLIVLATALPFATPGVAAEYGGGDLIGTWNGDVMASMKTSGMLEKLPPGFDVSQFAARIAITLTFEKDGTLIAYNKNFDGETTKTEIWELVSAENNVLNVKSTDEEGDDSTVVITFTDKNRIQVVSPGDDAAPVVFERVLKKAEAETEAKAEAKAEAGEEK